MATQYTVKTLSGEPSASKINENLQDIKDELDEKLDRRALASNELNDDLDMNDFRISNVKAPAQGNDVATKNHVTDQLDDRDEEILNDFRGLLHLLGRDTDYIIGLGSFDHSSSGTDLTIEAGVLWLPNATEKKLREVEGQVTIDNSSLANDVYTVKLDKDNEYQVEQGTLSDEGSIINFTISGGAITSTSKAITEIARPTDFEEIDHSTARGQSFEQLDARLEAGEQEVVDARDSSVYGAKATLDARIEEADLEIQAARTSDVYGAHASLDARIESVDSEVEAARDSAANSVTHPDLDTRLETIEGDLNTEEQTTSDFRATFAGATETQSGDGATTVFTIAHGLSQAPTAISVTPGSTEAAASGDWHVSDTDATNIEITFGTAPANATDNLIWFWTAKE